MFPPAPFAAHLDPSLRSCADRPRKAGKPHKVINTAGHQHRGRQPARHHREGALQNCQKWAPQRCGGYNFLIVIRYQAPILP